MAGGDRKRNLDVAVRLNKEGDPEVIRDVVDDVKDLEPAARDAEKAVDKLGDSVEHGFRGSFRATTDARHALNQYREALDRAEDVTEEQVETLARLERSYDGLIDKVGDYRKAQSQVADQIKDVTGATDDLGGGFVSLEDVLGKIDPKMAKVAVGAVAVKEGFEFGYEAGTKLRNVLNDLTDGGFDRFIQQVTGFRAFADWVTGADAASDASQRLEANLKILAAAGFDTVGLSAEQAQRKVEEYYRAKGDAAGAERAATEAAREFAEALGESKEQLDAQAEALLKSIDSLERTGQALNSVQVGTLSDQLQALLGKYSEIGQEAPAAFGAAAAAVEDMAQRMAAATQKGKHELEALEGQMVSFPGAATDMASSTIKIVEAFDEAGRKVLLVTNRLTEAGQEIESIKLTEEGVFTNLGEGAKKAAEGTVKVIESVDEAGNVIKTVVNVAGEAAKALEGTGRGGEAGAKGIDAITKATAELTTKQAEAQKALAETAKALEGIAGASAGNIAVAFAGIAETVKVAFGGVIGFEAPILAGLDRVIAKSAECEAAIERVKKAVEGAVG